LEGLMLAELDAREPLHHFRVAREHRRLAAEVDLERIPNGPVLQDALAIPRALQERVRSQRDDRSSLRTPAPRRELDALTDADARHEAQRGAEVRTDVGVEHVVGEL